MSVLRKRLTNGLDVVIQENSFSKMFALQCWIGVGSLQEEPEEQGISHCIEHMLFKGTRNYAVGEISRKVEFLGGEMNAYTSFENTVFYLTLPARYAQEAVEILSEAIFFSTFDAEELEREKEVILEEMKRNNDSPGHALGRCIFESIYRGTRASLPIIGYESTVRSFTRDTLLGFHRKWYQPTNMKLIAVGDVKAEELWQQVEKSFGAVSGSSTATQTYVSPPEIKGVDVHIVDGDYEQPRLEIAFPSPGLLNDDVLSLDMAAFALGSGESSRLNRRIRDEQQLTSTVGCSIYAPRFGGLFELSAMPQAENYLACAEALGRELARLKYEEPVSTQELDRARANAKADRIYSEETVSGQAQSIGHALQTPYELSSDLVNEAKINRLSTADVAAAVERWLREDACVLACVVPKANREQLTAAAIKDAFQRGFQKPATKKAKGPQFKPTRSGIFLEPLTPQVTFVYKQQKHNGLLNLAAVCSGGLRTETAANAGFHHILADLLGAATQQVDYETMLQKVEGQGAVLAGFSGKDSFGLKLQCLSEQAPSLVPLFAETLLSPFFPSEQLQSSKLEVLEEMQMEKDAPASVAMRAFQQAVYGDHPYRYPVWGLEDVVQNLTPEGLLRDYERLRDGSHWIISGVGPEPFEVVAAELQKLLGSLKRSVPRGSLTESKLPSSPKSAELRIRKDREQVHLVQGTLGLSWNDPDRFALDILANALGGSGGQLFIKLRDEQSLAYSVAPIHSYGCHRGLFAVYMGCSPHKLEDARQGISRVWEGICRDGLSQAELERARNYLIGSHESDMQRADAQCMTMALMELYGLGFDDFETYAQKLQGISKESVQKVAQRMIWEQQHVSIQVGPLN